MSGSDKNPFAGSSLKSGDQNMANIFGTVGRGTVQKASGSGDVSGLFGMPPVPQISAPGMTPSSSSSSQLHSTFASKSPLQAPAKIFGEHSSGSTAPTSFTFASKGPSPTFSKPFTAIPSSISGTANTFTMAKTQTSNLFKTNISMETKSNMGIFSVPSHKEEIGVFQSNQSAKPDLFTGSSLNKGAASVFGRQLDPKPTEPNHSYTLFGKPSTPTGSTNLFAITNSTGQTATLFGKAVYQASPTGNVATKRLFGESLSSTRFSDGQKDAKQMEGLFGNTVRETTGSNSGTIFGQQREKSEKNPFAKPAPPQQTESTISNIFKHNQSMLPNSKITTTSSIDKSKPTIKDRLGSKSKIPLNRDSIETWSQLQSPPTSISSVEGTPSECGSESSENTVDTSPNGGGSKRFERLTSKEELMTIKSIICEQVPTLALNERIMGKHFSRFGEVKKMYLNQEKQTAIIYFADHKSAKKAKEKGQLISTKIPPIGAIFYHRKGNRRSSEMEGDKTSDVSIGSRRTKQQITEEVDDELISMGETSSEGMFQQTMYPSAGTVSGNIHAVTRGRGRGRKTGVSKASVSKISAISQELPEIVTIAPASLAPVTSQTISKSELLGVMQSQAIDDLDRYNILDARDKYVREYLPSKDGQTKLVGTCPDICSEKERYSRSSKNQLRVYEKIEGVIHHKAVVKEYSRAAAGASIPLPHELRPTLILKQTMDHLLCNVIDRIDQMGQCGSMEDWYNNVEKGGNTDISLTSLAVKAETVGDWFEFLWSATRGIRKDITQQDLTDLMAVDLVEKSARFHIMCAERLVEEDSHNFNKKLNDENLTKCIQTLQHMYYDLEIKGIQCQNQPEFRSYEVLLNMNDGDTLRRVQNLQQWIRESPEMKFALKILAALNNNNYVKFFKLVTEATLLQGCILLRYFDQVRCKALDTMIKAFCPSRNVTQFSLSKMMFILGFEDLPSCASYCRLHGLECEIESSTLYMERGTFSYPVETPTMKRAINIVESKRKVKWSAVVNGGPLPQSNPYLTYIPHDSFDHNGFLQKEAYEAKDQAIVEESDWNRSIEELQQRQEKMKSQEIVANEIAHELIVEVSSDIIHKVSSGAIKSFRTYEAVTEIFEEVTNDVTEEVAKGVAMEALKEAKNNELQKRIKREETMAAAEQVSQNIADEVVLDLIKQVARDETQLVEQNLKLRKQLDMAPIVLEDICKEVVNSELIIIAEYAIKEAIIDRENLVEAMRKNKLNELQRKIFSSWRHYVIKLQKQKNILANFPSTPTFKSVAEQADLLSWGNQNDEKPYAPKSLKNRLENRRIMENLFKTVDLEGDFLDKLVLKKVDLCERVGKRLTQANPLATHLTWKLIICLPNTHYESKSRAICETIKRKLTQNIISNTDDPNVLLCQSVPCAPSECFADIFAAKVKVCSFCVRCVTSQVLDEEIAMSEKIRKNTLSGTSAILFIHIAKSVNDAPEADEYISPDDGEDDPQRRLDALLRNIPRDPPVPLLVMTTSRDSLDEVATNLNLSDWMKRKYIRIFNIIRVSLNVFNLGSLVNIHTSIDWLAENSPPPNYPMTQSSYLNNRKGNVKQLSVKPISQFVEDFLSEDIYSEMYSDLKDRQLKGHIHQHPNTLIGLYNAAIEHLIKVCRNPELQEVSWPIPELQGSGMVYGCGEVLPSYWNDVQTIDKICESLKSLVLPQFNDYIRTETTKAIQNYLSKSIIRSYIDSTILQSKITRILERAYRGFERQCTLAWNGDVGEPHGKLLPWTDLIRVVIDYKMSCMNRKDPFITQEMEMIVGYFDFDFHFPMIWTSSLGWKSSDESVDEYINQSICEVKKTASLEEQDNKLEIKSELDGLLLEEISRAAEFEAVLKATIDGKSASEVTNRSVTKQNEFAPLTRGNYNEEEVEALRINAPRSSRYYYVPVVSYLSPTLGLYAAASPTTVRQRVEVYNSKHIVDKVATISGNKKQRLHKSPSNNEHMMTNFSSYNTTYTHSKSGIIQTLKDSVEKDMDESDAFDKKLQEALMID